MEKENSIKEIDRGELLRVEDLSISFPGRSGRTLVAENVGFELKAEETVGLVGESGSGKTVTALAIMRLNRSPAQIESGVISFRGNNLQTKPEHEMQQIRGRSISMIFQSPRSSLNPLMKVGDQIYRVLRLHQNLGRQEARMQARKMLQRVGIPESERHMQSYPHQLSGGMCQRILIAMMVACEPRLLIADEPTTGLDVTVQAQIFELIKTVQQEQNMAMLLITHDLGVIAELCERMVVMYAGHVMEAGPVEIVFSEPHHPYTKMLLQSVMRADRKIEIEPSNSGGFEENVYALKACRFAPRCPEALDICRQVKPIEIVQNSGRRVMCHLYSKN